MVNKKGGLGKGFGSLLPDNFDESILTDKKDRVQKLLISDILKDPQQPRKRFDATEIDELSQSIKRFGILQPIVVRPHMDTYMIVAGERRYHAAKKAGLTHLPALVRTPLELERLEIGLIENMQRVDLSSMEQAISIARLNQQFNISYQDIAKRLGKAHTTVINIVRLLQLPDTASKALEQNQITEGHARAILALKENQPSQEKLLANIIRNKWSVRQAEQFVSAQRSVTDKNRDTAKKHMRIKNPETRRLSKQLHADVTIARTAKGGRLQIAFSSDDELNRILVELLKS